MSNNNVPGWQGHPKLETIEVPSASAGYAPQPEGTQDYMVGPARSTPYSPPSYSGGYGMWGTSPEARHGYSRTVTPPMVPYAPATPSSRSGRSPVVTDTYLLRM